MKQVSIKKTNLNKLLQAVAKDYTVYAPVQSGDKISLSKLGPDAEPVLKYDNFALSAKSFFLPQEEVLCTFENNELKDVPVVDEQLVLFGVRPCDTQAIACQEKLFGEFGGSSDPYFLKRRQNAVLITLTCTEAAQTCFCTSVGGDPGGKAGADIVAFDVDKILIFEAQTEKGAAFMKKYSKYFSKASKSDIAALEKVLEKVRRQMPEIDISKLKEKLEKNFDSDEWEKIADICLGCGLCTYQCPTCHCFDITDEKKGNKGRRIRTWDSCQFSLFTAHASGHNPRTLKKERMRQRILHKFLYTVDNVGAIFCSGCGRCVKNCPVNLDVREVIKKLASEE